MYLVSDLHEMDDYIKTALLKNPEKVRWDSEKRLAELYAVFEVLPRAAVQGPARGLCPECDLLILAFYS